MSWGCGALAVPWRWKGWKGMRWKHARAFFVTRVVTAFGSINMQMLMLIQFSVSIIASLSPQHFG